LAMLLPNTLKCSEAAFKPLNPSTSDI
jgi:hypothetical protein